MTNPSGATPTPEQNFINQLQSAYSVEEAKNAGAKQMIDELTTANVHLRGATILLQNQIKGLSQQIASTANQARELDQLAHGELVKENQRLKEDNDRLNRVVLAFDNKLTQLHGA